MEAAACIAILLGMAALAVDLGNRLFGSYVRTTPAAAWRIALLVTLLMVLAAPILWRVADPFSPWPARLLLASAMISVLAVLHFLRPYRWGIRRPMPPPASRPINLTTAMHLTDLTFTHADVPACADGCVCLVLSDLHGNSTDAVSKLREALAKAASPLPDLVLLLGDFGENRDLLFDVVAAVGSIPSRYGTYCVLGNHDYEYGREQTVLDLLSQHRVRVLAGQSHTLPQLGITLLGLDQPWKRCPLPPHQNNAFTLCLTHSPDNLLHFPKLNVTLGLAGHTHGGKLRLPIVGPVLVPSRLGRFIANGWFTYGPSWLYVTRGIGYFPGRMGNTGEICRLTLTRPPASS